jgi:glycosyltransferase involved in cell wall biosynthesis
MRPPVVLVTGPHRAAVSGVSTHVNQLMGSRLAEDFELVHFQVGSEGREEGRLRRWLRLVSSPLALLAAIVFREVAVVHLNTSLNVRAFWRDLAYLLVAKALRARVLWQVHGGALPEDFFKGRMGRAFLRRVLQLPDQVVVLARIELEAYDRFVPGQRVALVPNGIECRPFVRVPTVCSRSDFPLRLVYIGRIEREKGLYETLQAIHLARELGVDVRIIIAGQGSETAALVRQATALGISQRVHFIAPVFGDAKVRLLGTADVALLPSYAEGLPYALLEAMAAGVPVIATAVGAIPDVVTEGIHGHLVQARSARAIAAAIMSINRDRERLAWMSRACRRRILAAYSVERVAADLALIYRELAGDSVAAFASGGGPRVPIPPVPRPRAPAGAHPRN